MNRKLSERLQEWIRPFLQKDRLMILLLGGILLLVISLPTGKRQEKEGNWENAGKEAERTGAEGPDLEETYVTALKKELEELLSSVDGAGEVHVMISLEQTRELVADKEGKRTEPFVTKQMLPKLKGVVVVAAGASKAQVRLELSEAVQALFGLEAHRVKVLKLGHISSRNGIE